LFDVTFTIVGPYRFSGTDRARTLAHGHDLFDVLVDGLGSDAVDAAAAHRTRAVAAMSSFGTSDPDRALAELWSEWRSAMGAVRNTGAFGAEATAIVSGLFLSDGGVPKESVERVEIGFSGVVGDRQATRVHHGRPWQALCLWSSEVVAGLARDGHPISPGAAGENISIAGLDWARVRPGVRLRLSGVLAEISAYAVPCAKNNRWFADNNSQRIHQDFGPISRAYATVVEPGAISVGDAVLLEPAD